MRGLSVIFWSFCGLSAFIFIKRLLTFLIDGLEIDHWADFTHRPELRRLTALLTSLRDIKETICIGLVPDVSLWINIESSHPNFGPRVLEALQELRSSGASIQKSIDRFLELFTRRYKVLDQARARVSVAIGQCLIALFLIPSVGVFLFTLLPGVDESPGYWLLINFFAEILAVVGGFWMLKMAKALGRVGFSRAHQDWGVEAPMTVERFLALVAGGLPTDLAWERSLSSLIGDSVGSAHQLAQALGIQLWTDEAAGIEFKTGNSERAVIRFGFGVRKAIQRSLMEGKGCRERVESLLDQLLNEFDTIQENELQGLPLKVLKPVFICLAPGVLGVLIAGMVLSFSVIGQLH